MEGLVVLAIVVLALVLLDLGAVAFGTDSREAFAPRVGILS